MSKRCIDELLRHIVDNNLDLVTECLKHSDCNELVRQTKSQQHNFAKGLPVTTSAYMGQSDTVDILVTFGFDATEWAIIPEYLRNRQGENSNGDLQLYFRYTRYSKCHSQPIHFACKMGHTDIVTKLVGEYGVDIEAWDSIRNTPLFYAIMFHHTDTVMALIAYGAMVNVEFAETGNTPLYLAVEEQQIDMVRILFEGGAVANPANGKQAPFHRAIYSNNAPIADLLRCFGADPEIADDKGHTPLQVAILMQNYEMVKYLLMDLEVSLNSARVGIRSPFLMALESGKRNIIDIMISVMMSPQDVVYYHRNHPFFQKTSNYDQKKYKIVQMSSLQSFCAFTIRRTLIKTTGGVYAARYLNLPMVLKDLVKDIYERKYKGL